MTTKKLHGRPLTANRDLLAQLATVIDEEEARAMLAAPQALTYLHDARLHLLRGDAEAREFAIVLDQFLNRC